MGSLRRKAAHIAVAAMMAGLGSLPMSPSAYAINEPTFDPVRDVPPPDGIPAPPIPMKQSKGCVVSAVLEQSQFDNIPVNTVFEVPKLHQLAVGRGQTVAVIDSGVNANVRLPGLIGGGDYIMGGDGLNDCDHHGTLVAGIIAARPKAGDGFVGVAPEAVILSIRQTSDAFTPDRPPAGYNQGEKSASNVRTLAQAIVHAANMGATVINMSITACFDANSPVDTAALAGALHYASVVKNAVLIASAGNIGTDTACKQNPPSSASNVEDPDGWNNVVSVSLPSMWTQFVLSVGGTTLTGEPYVNTMGGPWVDVASPAINIVSLNPSEGDKGTLVNAQIKDGQPVPISGTSFAAAYISGLAALIREKHPELTANQVVARIKETAHTPAKGTMKSLSGSGIVDPVAALSATITPGEKVEEGVPPQGAPPPTDVTPMDHTSRTVAVYTMLGAAAVAGALALIMMALRAARRNKAPDAGL
jgi:membrane-anchored mycosin MYCP